MKNMKKPSKTKKKLKEKTQNSRWKLKKSALLRLQGAEKSLSSGGRLMPWLHQSPDSQTKSCQTEPDEKVAGSVWLPGPKVCRKLEGSWPDCTRQRQNFTLFTKRDWIWCCLAQSGQLPSIFLPIFGQGNQIEPAIFCLALAGMILSGCLGLGVARALALRAKT